jgi:hypothetical protein
MAEVYPRGGGKVLKCERGKFDLTNVSQNCLSYAGGG